MESKRISFLPAAALAVVLDQLLKAYTASTLVPGARVPLVGEWLFLTHVPARAGAFGIFRDWLPEAQLVGFALLASSAVAIAFVMVRGLAPGEHGSAAGLGALVGGIVGHTIDRLRFGSGLDTLHVGAIDSNAVPDFSLADVAITLGVVTLIIELIATELSTRAAEHPGARTQRH